MLLNLTKKERAAIEAVLDIALHGGGGLVQSGDITERQGIPPRYLEPILQRLGRSGILVGVRGPGGGYRLARERRRISLLDLVRAIRGEAVAAGEAEDGLADALASVERDIAARLAAVTVESLCWQAQPAPPAGWATRGAEFII